MRKLKRVLSIMSASIIAAGGMLSTANAYSVNDDNLNLTYTEKSLCSANSLMVSSEEENSEFLAEKSSNKLSGLTKGSSIPTSADLSSNLRIGCDGDMNISAAIATTKYQFTYEVNRLNGTATSEPYNFASVYNYICGGNNNPVSIYECYNVLANHGAIRCSNDYTEINVKKFYDYRIPQDDNKKIEALNTRIDYHYHKIVSGTGTPITNVNSDFNLNTIKRLISQGKMPVVEMQISLKQKYYSTKRLKSNPNEYAIYRVAKPNSNTNLCTVAAVVGYDDTVTCDINGNGTIEDFEHGAFKIALTWGNTETDNGFAWVMYDALNKKSASPTNTWENNLSKNRIPAFMGNDWNQNRFYFIEVKNYDPALIGKLQINTNGLSQLKLTAFKNNNPSFNSSESNLIFEGNYKPATPITNNNISNIMFDYDDLANPLTNLNSGKYFGIKIENKYNGHSYQSLKGLKFSLIDNFNKNVAVVTSLNSEISIDSEKTVSKKLNLKLGDMNYDNYINEKDIDILTDYMLLKIKLSNLQCYVGDVDKNGVVDLADLIAIKKSLNSVKAINKVDTFVEFYKNNDLNTYSKLSPEEKCMKYSDIMNLTKFQEELK